MYDFHNNYIFRKYYNDAKLYLTDIDSFVCKICSGNVSEDVREGKEPFNAS